ncbi:MAG: hypothetical protein JO242_10280 [Streptosporangiaceae bacterium]|nr:hypothetical protein [Streptosporangiaceae bacterium]
MGLVEQQARPGRLTEGMAWLTSALAVGTAAGSAAAGQVIDAGGARWLVPVNLDRSGARGSRRK